MLWQIVVIGVVGAMIVGGLWQAARSIRRRKPLQTIGWAAIAALPPAMFFGTLAMSQQGLANRAQYLAALPRTHLGGVYPRTLIARGYPATMQLGALIGAGVFDKVYHRNADPGPDSGGEAITISPTPDCQDASRRYLGELRTGQRPDWRTESALRDCTTATSVSADEMPTAHEDGVLLLSDGAADIHPRKVYYTRYGLEVRVRRDGVSHLVDYWERPYVLKPSQPFDRESNGSWMVEKPQGEDMDRIAFLLAALAR